MVSFTSSASPPTPLPQGVETELLWFRWAWEVHLLWLLRWALYPNYFLTPSPMLRTLSTLHFFPTTSCIKGFRVSPVVLSSTMSWEELGFGAFLLNQERKITVCDSVCKRKPWDPELLLRQDPSSERKTDLSGVIWRGWNTLYQTPPASPLFQVKLFQEVHRPRKQHTGRQIEKEVKWAEYRLKEFKQSIKASSPRTPLYSLKVLAAVVYAPLLSDVQGILNCEIICSSSLKNTIGSLIGIAVNL